MSKSIQQSLELSSATYLVTPLAPDSAVVWENKQYDICRTASCFRVWQAELDFICTPK
jgi:hypothetical protein